MPIYAYQCASCGHTQDVLQKLSDLPLSVCPQCGSGSYHKQVTAAGFQLKGSGWYVTDFRGSQRVESAAQSKAGVPADTGSASSGEPASAPPSSATSGAAAAAPTPSSSGAAA